MTRSHRLADLDRGEPDAAGGAEDGERLAWLEPGAVLQGMQRRSVGHAQAGGAVEVEAVGHFDQFISRDSYLFARRAVAGTGDDTVARLHRRHALAHALDHAGKFGSRRERQGRLGLIFIGDNQRVEEIERGRVDTDHRLALAGDRVRYVAEDEIVLGAVMGAEQDFHGYNGLWMARGPGAGF